MNPAFIEASIEILKGARPVDLSKIHNLHYGALRDSVHRFCRQRNRILYNELLVQAAHYNRSQPKLSVLRAHKDEFLGTERSQRPATTVEKEINLLEKQYQQLSQQHRETRALLEQRRLELQSIENQALAC
ncbi:hypothetical protein H0A36_25600 [Endozoicomonas sp. SM1973]|uniref:Uncharacterized protein n=1 Tax=Spartinivicinus marinus TaxID=2994442 RepID=A0A853IFT1_9GAMM|nr:hypothetical protein [Spartinivicinus marinus]MCX4030440.1 hypothetical protein [Spartinivicinus marinus]NYZ69398.1 hypothetical protein [Spartinivicinus marinus]